LKRKLKKKIISVIIIITHEKISAKSEKFSLQMKLEKLEYGAKVYFALLLLISVIQKVTLIYYIDSLHVK